MYHPTKKFIFIHPPKCAGTSIRLVLREHYGSYDKNIKFEPFYINLSNEGIDYTMSVHSQLSEFAQFINDRHGKGVFKRPEWYVFAVIRNPFDRLVSFYHHLLVNRNLRNNNRFSLTFDEWVCKKLNREDFALNRTYKSMFHYNNEVSIDHFIRQENIEQDAKIVFDKLGIPDFELGHMKHNTNRKEYDYRKYYNDETKEIVSKLFEWDINYFGYKF
jgi:hypothetical protein